MDQAVRGLRNACSATEQPETFDAKAKAYMLRIYGPSISIAEARQRWILVGLEMCSQCDGAVGGGYPYT